MPVKPKAKQPAKQPVKKATVSNKKAHTIASNSCKSEKDWMAEDDFRTLARAREIEADKARLDRAKKAAQEQAAKAAKLAATIGAKK